MSEIFSGNDVDDLMKVVKKAVREGQSINTNPIRASVDGDTATKETFVHTIVPITTLTERV